MACLLSLASCGISDLSYSIICYILNLSIPGCRDRVPGFQYQQTYYRLVQREVDARVAIESIAERACRGDELAVIPTPNNYGILVLDPSAIPVKLASAKV